MTRNRILFYVQLGLTLLCCLFLIVPVIQSVLAGVTENYFKGISSGLTLRWLVEMWELYADTIFRSMGIAFMCLLVCLAAGVPAAYVLTRSNSRWSRLLQELLVLPLAVPGLAIAMGILLVFGGFTSFRQSNLFILTGHVVFCLPFMVRSVSAVLGMLDLKILEEGAASLGAGFWRRFLEVIVPSAVPGILAGSLMVFTLSVGEFNLTWMLHTPLTKTLPVGLADSYASMRLEIGSAYTVAFFLIIIPVLVAMQWLARLHETRTRKTAASAAKEMASMEPGGITASTAGFTGASVQLTHCAKTFADGTKALEPLELSIAQGETLVFLGPSGCGKTTTLRIIAGLESPDKGGMVLFDGEDVTRTPIERRNVGMVFQNYALFPNMSVLDNVAYGLKVRGESRRQRHAGAMEMLEMMRIADLASRHVDQLSGGQRQRVALARALVVRPKVLLLDEPLTALDAKLREVLRAEIDMLLKSLGVTAVYVTHDQAEAMALGDRIAVMDKGRIIQIGTPRDIYFNPADHFVADFIGVFNKLQATTNGEGLRVGASGRIPMDCLSSPLHENASNAAMDVFFRPEDARIDEKGTLQGAIESSLFLGDKVRLLVRLGDGQVVKLDAPGKQRYVTGAPVNVALDPASVMVL